MKILFECDGGSYVVEVIPNRLYAKVALDKDIPVYDGNYSLLINPGSFHEYRGEEAMLQNRVEKIITEDLKKAMKK